MPVFEDRNPVARSAAQPGPRTLPDTFAGQVMRQMQGMGPRQRQMMQTVRRRPRQFSGREMPDTFYGGFGRAAQGNYQPPMAPGGMGMGGGGGGKGLARPAQFGGDDIMEGLGAIGDLVRRGAATFNEFIPGLGPDPNTAGFRAMQAGGMYPQQQAQPFFRRPAWLDEYYRRGGG